MKILGLSCFYHDSAAVLLVDGKVLAAAQEERFTRIKHDASYPQHAIEYCLNRGGLTLGDIDYVSFYDKPFIKFERLFETYLSFAPQGIRSFIKSMPVWMSEKIFQKNLILERLSAKSPGLDLREKLLFSEHHLSHAASAFYPSPFEEAAVLTLDGVGEWATSSFAVGKQNSLEIVKEIHFPHSLGLLYSAFTYYTGFRVNSGEYKLMGLAPYGEPRFVDLIKSHLIDIKSDGSFRLNMEYFDFCTGLTMTNAKFDKLFGASARTPEDALTQRHMDLAASIQKVTEEILLAMSRSIRKETGLRNLCLAGGVALNCVANGKIQSAGIFDKIWVQPAAGDAGGALGAALATHYIYKGQKRVMESGQLDAMSGSYLGPEFSHGEIVKALSESGARFTVCSEAELVEECSRALAEGKALGWFQGRMEYGPRALGNRSILADARSPETQSTLNLKVKYRESFRPFAPAVLREDLSEWFDLDADSPYMLLVANVNGKRKIELSPSQSDLFGIEKLNVPRSSIPAVTHVDYSARIQTVHKETNALYHRLISAFKARTGCPVVVNTSFNVRGEPVVCTPLDAFRCFMGTEIEVLAVGNCLLKKEQQDPKLKLNYKESFALD